MPKRKCSPTPASSSSKDRSSTRKLSSKPSSKSSSKSSSKKSQSSSRKTRSPSPSEPSSEEDGDEGGDDDDVSDDDGEPLPKRGKKDKPKKPKTAPLDADDLALFERIGRWFVRSAHLTIHAAEIILVGFTVQEDGLEQREREDADAYEKRVKHNVKIHDIFERLQYSDEPDFVLLFELIEKYKDNVPILRRFLNKMHSAGCTARASDTSKIKDDTIKLINDPLFLLYRNNVQERKIIIPLDALPAFLFDQDAFDPDFPRCTYLRGFLLKRVFLHIFFTSGIPYIGMCAVPGDLPHDDDYEKKNKSRSPIGVIHHMSHVKPEHIAYAAVQMYYMVNSMTTWKISAPMKNLYDGILHFLYTMADNEDVIELMRWYDELLEAGQWTDSAMQTVDFDEPPDPNTLRHSLYAPELGPEDADKDMRVVSPKPPSRNEREDNRTASQAKSSAPRSREKGKEKENARPGETQLGSKEKVKVPRSREENENAGPGGTKAKSQVQAPRSRRENEDARSGGTQSKSQVQAPRTQRENEDARSGGTKVKSQVQAPRMQRENEDARSGGTKAKSQVQAPRSREENENARPAGTQVSRMKEQVQVARSKGQVQAPRSREENENARSGGTQVKEQVQEIRKVKQELMEVSVGGQQLTDDDDEEDDEEDEDDPDGNAEGGVEVNVDNGEED
ncbi:hypothetical protein BDZ89DRAFT_1150907 [Hymenopellis radicata]|nr:hypothetical protein BDZ89DRAFT_1150907 [Hymenopellis radicata]